MKTHKEWKEYKKKNGIPDGAVEGVDFGPALDKCQKVCDSDKKAGDKLKAVNEFRKAFSRYSKELDNALKAKAKKFLTELGEQLDAIEKEAFAAAPKGGAGAVVNLDPGDEVIDPSSKSIAANRSLGSDKGLRRLGETDDLTDAKKHGDVVLKGEADFSKNSNEPIVILAHGTPIGKPGSGKVRASHFADKKPDDIINFISKSLDKTYRGVVYLDGCFTAAGNTPMNFAKRVYDGLVKKGYYYLQVKGNLGAAITVNGKEFVIPAELDAEYEKLKKENENLDKDIKAELKQYDDARGKLLEKLGPLVKKKKSGQLSPEESKTAEQLNAAILSVNKLEQENKKLKAMKDRKKAVTDIVENQLKIEALTGTFGPERLPPKP